MPGFDPKKLHVDFIGKKNTGDSLIPRKYTLTHSDMTGELFLSIGKEYDHKKLSNIYTRLMRDEVLGEWEDAVRPRLNIHCHTSGGIALGPAKWRDSIFRYHMPMVLEAICYGDRVYLSKNNNLLNAPVIVHFHSTKKSLDRVEEWRIISDFIPENLQ